MLLEPLGEEAPQEWQMLDQQAANTTAGEVDLVLDEQIEQLDPAEWELAEVALDQEIADEQALWETPEEPEIPKQYALQPQRTLKLELEKFKAHRLKAYNVQRDGMAVEPITADGACSVNL